jgi:hypothetical protein
MVEASYVRMAESKYQGCYADVEAEIYINDKYK